MRDCMVWDGRPNHAVLALPAVCKLISDICLAHQQTKGMRRRYAMCPPQCIGTTRVWSRLTHSPIWRRERPRREDGRERKESTTNKVLPIGSPAEAEATPSRRRQSAPRTWL